MALKISLGQYFASDSVVHRLDPRAKVCASLAIMISVFFIHAPAQLALGFAFVLATVTLARIPAHRVLESVLPIFAMLVVLGVFNLLLTTTGDVLVHAGPLRITTDGVRAALLYSTRLVIGVLAGALLLLTTTPAQLTDAFDKLLSPLARVGFPAHSIAMIFSLMLRFIPTLADEAAALVDAQTARGGALTEGSPIRRIRAVTPLIVSLLASSLNHANNLSRALDARCYEDGIERTHWHPLRMHVRDWLALALTCAYVTALVFVF